jgi:hypothetical protein
MSSNVDAREVDDSTRISINYDTSLEQAEILQLLGEKKACFGMYVRCQSTGLRELKELAFPTGSYTFEPGALLGRVQLRPMVWTKEQLNSYLPSGAHAEYDRAVHVDAGQFLAIEAEHIFDVAHPSLPPIESIFEIAEDPGVLEGSFSIDPSGDKVSIRMCHSTFQLVQRLRDESDATRAALMNALYAPVIMEILDQVRSDPGAFDHLRWIHPFMARCSSLGVDVQNVNLLTDAQKILEYPFNTLCSMIEGA